MSVADPVPGQIPGQDGALDAEHFHTDDLFCHGDYAGLYDAAFVDTVHAVSSWCPDFPIRGGSAA